MSYFVLEFWYIFRCININYKKTLVVTIRCKKERNVCNVKINGVGKMNKK